MYQFGIARTEPEIEELIKKWTLPPSNARDIWPFHTEAWTESLRQLLQKDNNFFYLYIEQHGQVSHILPLVESKVIKRGIAFKSLALACHPHSKYSDIICLDQNIEINIEGLHKTLKKVLKGYALFSAKAVPENSVLMAALQYDRAGVFHSQDSFCDYINVSDMESSEDNVSKNFRNNLRKSTKKFAKQEDLEVETSRDLADLPRLLEEFLQVEGSGWKAKQGSAIIQDSDLVAFYERLIKSEPTQLECEISIIRIDGQPISGQLSVICGETQYLLKIGYDEKFEKLAPGRYHLKLLLDQLIQQDKITTLNLMSNARWHAGWNPQKHNVSNVLLSGPGLIGKLLVFALKIKQRLARLKSEFPN